MDEAAHFGVESPSLKEVRDILSELRDVVDPIVRTKRQEEPDVAAVPVKSTPAAVAPAGPTPLQNTALTIKESDDTGPPRSAHHLRALLENGQVEAAIDEMTALAAEDSNRARFLRKLEFAEICTQTNRLPLAAVILEELDEEIKKLNLTSWESAALIARVWGGLYRLYRDSEEKRGRASELYLNLCRLDPWQGLKWTVQ
jgi:DNA-binding transcriptional ArsR family regulator